METKNFYDMREGNLDNQTGRNFEDISVDLAQEVSKEEYCNNMKILSEKKDWRVNSIIDELSRSRASTNLFDIFQYTNLYENNFRGYNQILKQHLDRKSGSSSQSLISNSLEMFSLPFYEAILKNTESSGANISGLPKKLNYLEHLN